MKIQSRFTKVALAAGLVVTSGGVALGLTSIASANAERHMARAHVAVANDSTTDSNANATGDAQADQSSDGDVNGMGAHAPMTQDNLLKALGLTADELKAQFDTGKSLADIAKAQNVDVADVKAALIADFKVHVDEEVASGHHTQAEGDAELARFKDNVDNIINQAGGPRGPGMGGKGGPGMGGHGPRMNLDKVAEVLNLTPAELKTQLQTKSLADVAKAQSVDLDKVTAVIVAEFKAHLDEEVASGEHTQAEADQKLADFKANLDTMVNTVRPAGGPGMGGRGGHHGGPGMGDMHDQNGGTNGSMGGTVSGTNA